MQNDPGFVKAVSSMFRVQVIADSFAEQLPGGNRLTTFRLIYPRCILAEVNTHRALSRSSESSRAVPILKRDAQLRVASYRPVRWLRNAKGMQAGEVLSPESRELASDIWQAALFNAQASARELQQHGVAKEEANRLTEPFALVKSVVTATDWDNFFALRTHGDAHPVFRILARGMYLAREASQPVKLARGEWHLPFIRPEDRAVAEAYSGHIPEIAKNIHIQKPFRFFGNATFADYHLLRWSSARCARVSYGKVSGEPSTPEADDETWCKLVGMDDPVLAAWTAPGSLQPLRPIHASPMEHQASPDIHAGNMGGNLARGWVQFRKFFRQENVHRFEPTPETVREWQVELPMEMFSETDPY